MDGDLRTLERAVAEGDLDFVEGLRAARVRAGLGWHGERLPATLVLGETPGVYEWTGFRKASRRVLGLEFVFIPAGDGQGPLYVARYPVTRDQYYRRAEGLAPLAFHATEPPPTPLLDSTGGVGRRPVTSISYEAASSWCAWAGLRLPTEGEWMRAARPPEGRPCDRDHDSGEAWSVVDTEGHRWPCPKCHGTGVAWPVYPWGDEPPTPERCRAADPSLRGDGSLFYNGPVSVVRGRTCGLCAGLHSDDDARDDEERRSLLALGDGVYRLTPGPTAVSTCMLCWNAPVPARPESASYWGVQDLVGHVLQWTTTAITIRESSPDELDEDTGWTDPVGTRLKPGESRHVLKGGTWLSKTSASGGELSVEARAWFGDGTNLSVGPLETEDHRVGFRPVLDGLP